MNAPASEPSAASAPQGHPEDFARDELPQVGEEDAQEVIVLDESINPSGGLEEDDDDDDDLDIGGGAGDMMDADAEGSSSPLREDAVLVLTQHKADALCVAASPVDKKMLASGGQDDVGALWDLEDGLHVGEVDGAGESVSTVAFSADGAFVAFGSENGAIAVVLMNNAEAPRAPLDGPSDAIASLAWHPRGPLLLAASSDGLAYLWNAAKAKFMMAFAGHDNAVSCASFSGDGKLVVTSSVDMSVRIWNPTTGEGIRRVANGMQGIGGVFHTADLLCHSVGPGETPAGKLVATGCAAGDVYVSQIESGTVVARLQSHEGGVESMSFSSADVRPIMLATGGVDGKIRVWDSESGMERCTLEHTGVIVKVVWHAKLPLLASGSANGTVALWDGRSGNQLALFHGPSSFVTDICFAGGQEFVAATSADGAVRVFDIRPALKQYL